MTPLSDLLNRHRSIRAFKTDAIAGGSSSGNLNSISLILTRDPARKEVLYGYHFEQEMVRQAPLLITFCADWQRTRRWLKRRGARDNFNNLIGYHVAAFDALIVAQNVCLGFEAHGLGICYMGTTLHSMRKIADFLELPDTCLPVTSIVVGYPAEDPTKRDRLPLDAFLHDERYQDPDDAALDRIYAEREIKGWQRYMSIPQLRAEIEAMGITSLAQFYTSKAKYDPDDFRADSDALHQLLADKHFL